MAFRLPFQYLLKPVDEGKFAEVLQRAEGEAKKKKEKKCLFIRTRNLTLMEYGEKTENHGK